MSKKSTVLAIVLAACLPLTTMAADTVRIDVIKNPYGGGRNTPELSTNPDYIHAAGLERLIEGWGGELIRPVQDVRLKPEQEHTTASGIAWRWPTPISRTRFAKDCRTT